MTLFYYDYQRPSVCCFHRLICLLRQASVSMRGKAIDMRMIVHSHANKNHVHNKGFVLRLVLKVRVFGTRKWPIRVTVFLNLGRLN